jgi:hypothetical protein
MTSCRAQYDCRGYRKAACTQGRCQPLTDRIAQEATGKHGVASCRQRAGAIRIGKEQIAIERDIIVAEAIARLEIEEFVDRHAGAHLEAGGCLLVGRVAIVVEEVEAVQVAAEYVTRKRNRAVEQIGLGKPISADFE